MQQNCIIYHVSILKQLIILQIIIAIVGAVALRYLVQKIRNKLKE